MRRSDIRASVNRRLHGIGWDFSRHPSADDPGLRRQGFLAANVVDLVIDVGANTGIYGQEIRSRGYDGHIASFEPTAEAFSQLEALAAQDGNWSAQRVAVGASTGQITMHVGEQSVTSSALPMPDRLATMAFRYVADEAVPMDRLDNLVDGTIERFGAPFLKSDTQGFEHAVLMGAHETLKRIVGLEIELALQPVYDGEPLWRDEIKYVEDAGFRLIGLTPAFWDVSTGETLHLDGLFARK